MASLGKRRERDPAVAARLPPQAHRVNPRVVKQKTSNVPVKGAPQSAWPQPTKPFRDAILLLN